MPRTAHTEPENNHAETAARAATALFFLNGIVVGSWVPRVAELRDKLDISEAVLGRSLMGMGLGGLFGSLAAGVVINRFGTRTMTAAAGLLLMLLLPTISVVDTAWLLFLSFFLIGSVDASVDIGMNAQAVHTQELLGRSSINRVHAMWSIGSLTGGVIGTASAALGVSLLSQLVTVAIAGAIVLSLTARDLLPYDAPTPPTAKAGRIGPAALFIGVAALAAAVLEGSAAEWSSLMLSDERDATKGQAGLGFVAFSGAMLVARLVADRVVDAVGTKATRLASVTLISAGLAVVVFASSIALTLAGYVLMGIGLAPVFPLLYQDAATRSGSSAGTGLAVMSSGMRVGFLGAPPVIGALAAAWSLQAAFGAILGIAVAITLAQTLQASATPNTAPEKPTG